VFVPLLPDEYANTEETRHARWMVS
jgi:hypothetical protein